MYGAVPGIFESREAAQKAADAYSLETISHWLVFEKVVEGWGSHYYKPVEFSDAAKAVADGWVESPDDNAPETIKVFHE